jgi:hypothetical protein
MCGGGKKLNYLSRLEFVFDTVLKAFAFNFHRREYEAISNEMCSVPDSL